MDCFLDEMHQEHWQHFHSMKSPCEKAMMTSVTLAQWRWRACESGRCNLQVIMFQICLHAYMYTCIFININLMNMCIFDIIRLM